MVSVGLFLYNFQDFIAPQNIINNFKTSHWLSTNCICVLGSIADCNYFRINYRKDTKLQNVALTRVDCKSTVYHMFVFFILRNSVPSKVFFFFLPLTVVVLVIYYYVINQSMFTD